VFSIVVPLDLGRFEQFENTKRYYDSTPQEKEFVIPTRNYDKVAKYLEDKELYKNVRLIPYVHKMGFNPSKAFNLGVKNAKYDRIIITSPEVIPLTPVLDQFEQLKGKNVLAQVFDEAEDGGRIEHMGSPSLVHAGFRNESPAMYFLAMFNKADIEKINGWDEDFMAGYAWEDNDFGDRWIRAGLPFEVHDEIQGLHQYHPRAETIAGGLANNMNLYQDKKLSNIIRCRNGIVKE
jgi:GT2 family glycosyltransferase